VIAFAPGSHDAAVAARGTGAMLIHDVPGSSAQQILAPDGPSFNAPVGIAFSADGKRVFVASASQQLVAGFDLSGNRADLACSCTPSELVPMGTSLRLNELSGDPLWLVDTGAAPRVVFVPAMRAAQ
jgi:DNA-binding beta-propeller fold protein YncE